MSLGRIDQAWNALYDNLYLTSRLEKECFEFINGNNDQTYFLAELSADTKNLIYSTTAELSDYFRDRRDYIESLATLDIIICLEKTIREDLEERKNGIKSQSSAFAHQLINTSSAGNQPPAARRLLGCWRNASGANQKHIDAIDQGMQYRNWLVHGEIGYPPFLADPFSLHIPTSHLISIILNEP